MKKIIIKSIIPLLLTGCTGISQVGSVGPSKLKVYSIKEGGFLSESKMLVILDKKGNVAAYTGGTVAGIGSVGLETAGTFATAGAIAVGAKAIEHGLENAKVSGIPKSIKINTSSRIDVNGVVKTLK